MTSLVRRDPDTGYLDTWLWVPKKHLNVAGTKSALTFVFPDRNSDTGEKEVRLWKETPAHLLVPRAFWEPKSLPYRVVDMRPSTFPTVDIQSKIKLDHRWRETPQGKVLQPDGNVVQGASLAALLASTGGGLQLACGKGKTIVFLEMLAVLKMPGLIVVPDTTLMEQWRNAIDEVLIVPDGIGLIQGPKNDWHKPVVLTTYHTLGLRAAQGSLTWEMLCWFATIGWDEGHHISAPMFAPSAPAFPGRRIYLTATPERDDGLHILVDYHIGGVLYKDLSQDLKPRIFFRWTGLELNDARYADASDVNGELHLSKLAGTFGSWPERVEMVLNDILEARNNDRKVLVLSNSEAEIVNLASMWEALCTGITPAPGSLFSDIIAPTEQDIGETVRATMLSEDDLMRLRVLIKGIKLRLEKETNPSNIQVFKAQCKDAEEKIHQHDVWKKINAALDKLQKKYVKELIPKLVNCGIIIHKVPPKQRREFINNRKVTFAIMKYGKEGLDAEALDTVLVSTPFSSRNGLQQLMGRPTRDFVGKKTPTIVFYVDNIGPLIGMCRKLMSHLHTWAHEEGGPFDYEKIDYPKTRSGTWKQNMMRVFGP